MLDDDMIKRLAHSATMIRVGNFWHASLDDLRTFSSACYAEGQRDAQDRIAELERDAKRYRWLRGDSCAVHSVRWTQWGVRCWIPPVWSCDLRRTDLDAAIDAAMRKEGDDA